MPKSTIPWNNKDATWLRKGIHNSWNHSETNIEKEQNATTLSNMMWTLKADGISKAQIE